MTLCAEISPKHKRYDYRKSHKCVDCGKERLICYKKGKPESIRCHSCATKLLHNNGCIKKYYKYGKDNPLWKGGKSVNPNGYISIRVHPNSQFSSMRSKYGWVYEHRLVVAQSLGRSLYKTELVHHKNGIKGDNRIENLELVSHLENLAYEKMCRNCELKKEIRLLRWQLKELSKQLQERLIL